MNRASAATMHPHQRRQQERQLEANATGGHGPDVVAALERRAVQGLASYARLRVPESDAGLLRPVVGEEIGEPVVVHIDLMIARSVGRSRPIGTEGQRGHVHVEHIEGVGAEEGDGDDAPAGRVDGVGVAAGLDVNDD